MKESNRGSSKIRELLKNPKLIDILVTIMVLGAIMVKIFYFQFTTGLNRRPFLGTINNLMMLANFGMTLIIIAVVLLIFNKRSIIGLLILDLFVGVLLLADTIYFRYYYSALSITMIYQLKLAGSIGDSILSLFKTKDMVYILDIPIIIGILFLLKKCVGNDKNEESLGKRLLTPISMITIGVLLIFISFKNTDTSTFAYDNNYIIKHGGVAYYHYYDIKGFIKNNYLTDRKITNKEKEEITAYFENKEVAGEKYKGISKDKNLIVIQVEALQHFIIGAQTLSGEEITPNLNKLIGESKYFDNIYYQTGGGNTSDAEMLVNASLYPSKEGSSYFLYPNNTYLSIGNILKERGYNTYASHANSATFWNRALIYPSLGFDEFFSNEKFRLDEYVGWGLGDKSFYKQTIDKIDKEKPFYSMMISLSSHYPFKYKFFERYDFNVGEYEDTFLGYYIKSVHYADMAIGSLIDYLKEQGLYDNSLIVIYGDHQAVPKEKSEELFKFVGKEYSELEWLKLQKIPLIIHDSDIKEPERVEKVGGQVDILPTIANLMDFNVPYALGKDLLNTKKEYAVLRNSTVITDEYAYLSNDGNIYDVKTGKILDESKYKEKIEEFQKDLYISDIILKKDALKYIKDKTE